MIQYKDFRPSGFDVRGLGLPDRQDWYVVKVTQTRDSEAIERSNFAVAELIFEEVSSEDSEDYENHRFNHWACGWFEILLVRPNSKCYEKALIIEHALEDYTILSETHLSQMD